MAKTWPRFVWRKLKNRDGRVYPEIWHTEQFRYERGADGKGIEPETLAQHDLTHSLLNAPIEELAKLFPPPKGYGWKKQPFTNVDPNQLLKQSPETPNSVEDKPTE